MRKSKINHEVWSGFGGKVEPCEDIEAATNVLNHTLTQVEHF